MTEKEEKIFAYLDYLKTEGWRPGVICAIVASGKMALFKSNDYPGYEFLQGGIEFSELPEDTFEREMMEELGYGFYSSFILPPLKFQWLFEDKLETKVKDVVVTRNGQKIHPKGKYYIVFAVQLDLKSDKLPQVNPEDFQFKGSSVKLHQCKWVSVREAKELIKSTKSPKKREIAAKAIEMLAQKGFCK